MKPSTACILLLLGLLPCSSLVSAQTPALPPVEPRIVPLWPDGSVNNPAAGPRPTLEIYRPFAPAHDAGATIVVFLGGGHGYSFAYDAHFSPRWRALVLEWLAARTDQQAGQH